METIIVAERLVCEKCGTIVSNTYQVKFPRLLGGFKAEHVHFMTVRGEPTGHNRLIREKIFKDRLVARGLPPVLPL